MNEKNHTGCGMQAAKVPCWVMMLVLIGSGIASAQEEVTFDDFKFDMKKTDEFKKSMITDKIREYEGKTISIRGFIRPSFKTKGLKQFILVRDDQECCFGPGAALFDCMIVRMAKGKSTNFTVRPITVKGEFKIRIFNGPDDKPWAVYQLKGLSVN